MTRWRCNRLKDFFFKNNFYFFQVIAGSHVRGWLDATLEPNNWLKYIRSCSSPRDINCQHLALASHLWYEVIKDIPAGTELLLGPRVALQLGDMFSSGHDDRETG